MSSDRTIYDQGAYMNKVKQASKPLEYVLDINRHENWLTCGNQVNVAKHADRVALESELLGHSRKLSKDPSQQYQKNDVIANTLPFTVPYVCERTLSHPSFLDQNTNNKYMEDLKKGVNPSQ